MPWVGFKSAEGANAGVRVGTGGVLAVAVGAILLVDGRMVRGGERHECREGGAG